MTSPLRRAAEADEALSSLQALVTKWRDDADTAFNASLAAEYDKRPYEAERQHREHGVLRGCALALSERLKALAPFFAASAPEPAGEVRLAEAVLAEDRVEFEPYSNGPDLWRCCLCGEYEHVTYRLAGVARPHTDPFSHAPTCPVLLARAVSATGAGREA